MSPRAAMIRSLAALAGATVLACVGNLEHEPSAYFGGVSVTGTGGRAGAPDAEVRAPAPEDRRPPPASPPDAAPMWGLDASSPPWDAPPVAPDAMATVMPPPTPDAAPSACAPGTDGVALLAMRCGGCHNPMNAAKGLDLRSPGLGMRTVGKASTCQGRPLLATGTGAGAPSGHLLDKLEGPVPGCGNQMPAGGPALSAQEKDCVREWAAQAIARVRGQEVMP